jgi:hypothetical protein
VWVQDWCTVCAKPTVSSEIILDAPDGTTRVTRLKWKLILVLLDIVLILTQDSCTVCIEHVTCSKIILDAPYGTPR